MDLKAFLCSLNLCVKLRPVCPTYALLHSGQVCLYAPDLLYLSRAWGFGTSSLWRVLLVCRVILMCAFLKMFVINVVSLPMYVKGGPFLCGFIWFLAGGFVRLPWGGVCVCIGNPLFSMML